LSNFDGGFGAVSVGCEVGLAIVGWVLAEAEAATAVLGECEELFVEGAEGGDCGR
jgi:hypothetical protein